jgi:hypothetical protein
VLDRSVAFGQSGSRFFVGEIELLHVRDDLFLNGKINTESLRPLARLAGPVYSTLGSATSSASTRPNIRPKDPRSL